MKGFWKSSKNKFILMGTALFSFLILLGFAVLSLVILYILKNKLGVSLYSLASIVVLILALILSVVITIIVFVAVRKAQKLIFGLSRVAAGDYSAKITYRRGDVFARVYKNFNKMTDELCSVKSMRDDFVHTFSHEIKTPLFSIQGFANLLLEGGLSEEEEQKFLKIISDEAGRLGTLADSILLLSKVENQQVLGEKAPLKLDCEITDCIIVLERQWDSKHIEIDSDLEPITINSDGAMLRQVWINLLSNAIKFTPEGGKISVSLKRKKDNAVICVRDTGCGIPKEDIPKIFDRYYRSPDAKLTEGNGLGLAICKRICTLAGGSISAESELGNGSTFTVELPLIEEDDAF